MCRRAGAVVYGQRSAVHLHRPGVVEGCVINVRRARPRRFAEQPSIVDRAPKVWPRVVTGDLNVALHVIHSSDQIIQHRAGDHLQHTVGGMGNRPGVGQNTAAADLLPTVAADRELAALVRQIAAHVPTRPHEIPLVDRHTGTAKLPSHQFHWVVAAKVQGQRRTSRRAIAPCCM